MKRIPHNSSYRRSWYGNWGSPGELGSDTREGEDPGHSLKNGTELKKLRTYTGNAGCSTCQGQSEWKRGERGIGLDQNYILPEHQEKDMGCFFAIIFFLFLITGGFHYFLLSLQLMTNAKP